MARITVSLPDGGEAWFDLKDVFTRKDLRRWRAALLADEKAEDAALEELRESNAEATRDDVGDVDELIGENNYLELLGRWCSGCYVKDEDGNEYHQVSELTRGVLDNVDAAIVTRFYSLPSLAFNMRANLGEVKSGRSSKRS